MKILALTFLLLFSSGSTISQDTKENAEFKLAVNLYTSKMYDLAVEQLKRFIDVYPNTAQGIEARFYLGLAQMELKQYEPARLTFQNFALSYSENPRAPEAWWKVAEIYKAVKNLTEAASAFERLKVFHPKSRLAPEALLKSAYYFRLTGVTGKAKKILRTLIQEYPTTKSIPEARLHLAELYSDEGNFDQARAELNRILKGRATDSLQAKALILSGKIYEREERYENAERAYKEVIKSYPKTTSYFDASYYLGLLQQRLASFLESTSNFKKVLVDTSATTLLLRQKTLLALGTSYFELKDFVNSGIYLDQLLHQNPPQEIAAEGRRLAALAHEEQKDYRNALEYYRAIAIDTSRGTDRRAGYVGAARVSRILKDFHASVSYLQRFASEYPNDPNTPAAVLTIAEIYERDFTGNEGEQNAIASYQSVLSQYPWSPLVDDALFRIAQVQEKTKEYDQAIKSYQELNSRYPSSPFVDHARQRVNWIMTFEPALTSVSLNKLAGLLARLIASESKGESAFSLGEIYFNDLKDYEAAAKMFTSAIENKVSEPHLAEAYYYRVRCYQILLHKNRLSGETALRAYEEFLKFYPSHQRSGDAAAQIALLEISSASPTEISKISEEFVLKYPSSTTGDVVVLTAGDSLMRKGRPEQAALAYRQLLEWFPSSVHREEALFQLGVTLKKLGREDSARTFFETLLNQYPDGAYTAEVMSMSAAAAFVSGSFTESIDLYRKLIEQYFYAPQAEKAAFDLARAYEAKGQLDSAIARTEALLRQESEKLFGERNTTEPTFLLATLYERKGNAQAAKKYYLASLGEGRRKSEKIWIKDALFNLSRLYHQEGNLESAVALLRQANEVSADQKSKKELANLLFETGEYAEATTYYTELTNSTESKKERIELEERLIIGLIRMGNLLEADRKAKLFSKSYEGVAEQLAEIEFEKGRHYFEKQDYTPALNAFQRVIKEFDRTKLVPPSHYWIGKTFEATTQNQKALEKYNEILKKFSGSEIIPRVYLALGNIHYRTEKFDTAIRYYRKIVESSSPPADLLPSAMNNLIEAYKAVGLFEAALKLNRTFVERFPNDESVQDKRIDMGVLYEKLGYHDQSAIHLENLLEEADPDLEAEIRYYIGEAYFGKGEYKRAILEFLKVPYLVSKKGAVDWTATAFYMSGQAYEKMGKYDQAIGMYQQIVDRPAIDQTFKAAALKEIDRVNSIVKKPQKRSSD